MTQAGWGGADRLVVVDKPGGLTSHDVVARVRRLAGTRRVGHGGTLDPMATGLLVVGVGRATRLLTYVIGATKGYTATIRLGQSTVTDDALGDLVSCADPGGVPESAVRAAVRALTGTIAQVPSAVSAIKVDGRRAYHRVRAGEQVALAARTVTVSRFDLRDLRRGTAGPDGPPVLDLAVEVDCSSGTYIRALARDLGTALGVGGHLTALRRTAVGGFTLAEAATLAELAGYPGPAGLTLAAAAARFFPRRDADPDQARVLAHGGPLAAVGLPAPYAVFDPDGELLAIVTERDGRTRAEVVFVPGAPVAGERG